jgi:hypothetical protein
MEARKFGGTSHVLVRETARTSKGMFRIHVKAGHQNYPLILVPMLCEREG